MVVLAGVVGVQEVDHHQDVTGDDGSTVRVTRRHAGDQRGQSAELTPQYGVRADHVATVGHLLEVHGSSFEAYLSNRLQTDTARPPRHLPPSVTWAYMVRC
ncbi:hypothetical protein ACWDA3_60365 [Nonomuraea rubra]